MTKGIYEITGNSTKTLSSYTFPEPFNTLSETIVKVFTHKNKQIEKVQEELELSEKALKKTALILNESDKRIKGLLNVSQNAVVVINQFYEIVATNKKSEQVLKQRTKYLIGNSILNYVEQNDKERVRDTLDDLFSTFTSQTIQHLFIINELGNKQKVKVEMTPVHVSKDAIEANIIIRIDDEA